ncbi:DUF455-domain-containing protein [Polyporus arcularius HHB13444]|uniref:DUF455-domain-containing protein n=1 Tax=Polyporus arcularius HHB13444 TaxID=1314778 RepID=A0A5C3PD84_9APHY|nr:DUF455-domain-containing protein [Polyporus arcularius HHB13444]
MTVHKTSRSTPGSKEELQAPNSVVSPTPKASDEEWVSPLEKLATHSRFFLTLRSQEGNYHSLILFRLTSGQLPESGTENDATASQNLRDQIYVMEANCPHLGADMSHAEIEECDTGIVAVCPWHRYDFDLKTGHSETGLKACTYATDIRNTEDGEEHIWVETPEGGSGWRLVEFRPVSEEFADPPPPPPDLSHLSISSHTPRDPEPLVPTENTPTTLIQWAVLILNTADPMLKVQRTRHAVHLFRTGQLKSIGHRSSKAPRPPDVPPREELYARNTVDPGKMARRKNRAVMLHALANIEQWAIDLAWDIIARYGPSHPDLPPAFFADFTKMALDESKHFSLLTARLAALSPSTPYGSLPVHAGLWESAQVTFASLRARLAIIHLVHEARGLDVNPGTIEKFRRAGDPESVEVLETIHLDEVTHVTTGHRWFTWVCAKQGVDPVQTFRDEVKRGWRGDVKGPFNAADREKAGLTPDFYENLRGEMLADWEQSGEAQADTVVGYEGAGR